MTVRVSNSRWRACGLALCMVAGCMGSEPRGYDDDDAGARTPADGGDPMRVDAGGPRDGGAQTDGAFPDAGEVADAGRPDAAMATFPDAGAGPTQYVPGRTQSPLTTEVVTAMRAIMTRGSSLRSSVFAKVGASNTVNTNFLHCFAGSNVDLDGRTSLQAALDHFKAGDAAGTTPFNRTSLSATIGWSAWAPLQLGDPPYVQQEVDAITPRFALVMYGTNDIQAHDPFAYADNMLNLVDWLVDRGVIPIVSSVPPRDDDASADAFVDRYNNVARAVAQSRLVPFVDLHRELVPLPNHGIGSDGLHMNTYLQNGSPRGCIFTAAALQFGFNVRNLVTLRALDRVYRTLILDEPAPDAAPTATAADGSRSSPFPVGQFPFVASGNTATSGFDDVDNYPGCSPANESGNALTWRFTLDAPATVRAMVFDRGTVDVDVHLLDDAASPATCLARAHREVVQALPAGTYHVSVDTFVSSAGTELSGEFLLVLLRE